jgi:CRISPR-associated protein Csx17
MKFYHHKLAGCAPRPLANYLKGLAILRLVGEQADQSARGWWEGEQFHLLTTLSEDELQSFFLETYQPTPLLSPWNKGCGFFKQDDPGMAPLEQSVASRFQPFRSGIAQARKLIDEIKRADGFIRAILARTKRTPKGFQTEAQRILVANDTLYLSQVANLKTKLQSGTLGEKEKAHVESELKILESLIEQNTRLPTKAEVEQLKQSEVFKRLKNAAGGRFKQLKDDVLIPACRLNWRGPAADWLSTAVVLSEEGKPIFPSMLGTGGNDGNLDFTNNFMQHLGNLFDLKSASGAARKSSSQLLRNCLWGEVCDQLVSAKIGQFQPGTAGGANSSTGFQSGNLINPWDFVLMLEGAVLFQARATRRLDPVALRQASSPFSVHSQSAGIATAGGEKNQRGEQWMPLWTQPATLPELKTLLGEARLQLHRQTASRPLDVARAISRLGVARGFSAFERYGYLERNGQSNLAVPLGRVIVRSHPQAFLIDDLSGWLDRLRLRSRDKNAPGRLVQAERQLATAVFSALTHDNVPVFWQGILIAAAGVEELQSGGSGIKAGPIPPLRPAWVKAINDGTPEFRLALSLGSAAAEYRGGRRPVDSVRNHFLPLDESGRRFTVSEDRLIQDPRVVVNGRSPARDLAALVERRILEAGTRGQRRLPLVSALGCGARLSDLAALIEGAVDLQQTMRLARGLMAIRWSDWSKEYIPEWGKEGPRPEACWLAQRLCCLAGPLSKEHDLPADPRLIRLLVSGDAPRAVELARTRLRSAGIRPPMLTGVADPGRTLVWAAAMAFPIENRVAQQAAAILDPSLKGKSYV